MTALERKLLFALFFLSGFCGLTYQVVWVRMALASFGVITPVLSIVISVFMFGLFAGSWLAGKAAAPFVARTRLSAIWLYALAELLIAAGAIAVPRLLSSGVVWLLHAGESEHQFLDQVVRHHPYAAVVLLLGCSHGFHNRFPPSGSIGLTTPRARTMTMWTTTRNVTPIGSSTMCRPYI